MTRQRFTPERRERLLTLLETGRSVEEAAADVGVNPSTVFRWAAKGRDSENSEAAERPTAHGLADGAENSAAAFAERFDAIRQGQGKQRLSEEDVVRLLEQAARTGSVTAMKILLDRFKLEPEAKAAVDEFDELKARRRARGA